MHDLAGYVKQGLAMVSRGFTSFGDVLLCPSPITIFICVHCF